MKARLIFAFLMFASFLFAQSVDVIEACQASCCEDAGGTWEGGYCYGADPTYYDCVEDCTAMADIYFGENGGCCCGTAFILLLVGGAVVAKQK